MKTLSILLKTSHSSSPFLSSSSRSPFSLLHFRFMASLPLSHPTYTIWAANTNLGKTLISAGIASSVLESPNSSHFNYIKPVQTGFPSDSDSRFVFNKVSDLFRCRRAEFSLVSSNYVANSSDSASMKVLGQYEERKVGGELGIGEKRLNCRTLYAWNEAVSPHLAVEREGGGGGVEDEDEELLKMVEKCLWMGVEDEDKGECWTLIETAGGVASPGPSGTLQCDLYRPWKRAVELALAGKRKLGFVTGLVKRDEKDEKKQEMWDTCNNLVISWLLATMSDTVKRSVLYFSTARAMWIHLEKRFTVSNGAMKYKLKKELYDTKQNGGTINEYCTKLSVVWEEIESLKNRPAISGMTLEITAYIQALEQEKEEDKLFQFLNGLDDEYAAERSHLLIQAPLPTVDTACAALQQEESQREVFNNISKLNVEGSAMQTSKGFKGKIENKAAVWKTTQEGSYKVCGRGNHPTEKCWQVIGYPKGHPLAKSYNKVGKGDGGHVQKWNKGRGKLAANVSSHKEKGSDSQNNLTQQIEQLLKLIPGTFSGHKGGSDYDDDNETAFAGLTFKDA